MEYNEDKFVRRSTRESVLYVPEMYIGYELDAVCLQYLILIISEDALNPFCANQCTRLQIVVVNDHKIILTDNGRGIPLLSATDEITYLEMAINGFTEAAKTHEQFQLVGFLSYMAAVLSALAHHLIIETTFEGKTYRAEGNRGELTAPLKQIATDTSFGARITFEADPQVFENMAFDSDLLRAGLNTLSKLYPRATINFDDHRTGQNVSFV